MFIVEGNIGAGKSTFLNVVHQHLPAIHVYQESLHNWQKKVYGQSLLANFYQDPQRWAYTLETMTLICRAREHLELQAVGNQAILLERSVYSGHYCFSTNSYEQGFMNATEWELYNQWFTLLVANKCQTPLGFIYLETSPELSYERIKKRNRLAEKNISLQYLRQIDTRHRQFLLEHADVLPQLASVPVLRLNCDIEFEENATRADELMHQLTMFMREVMPGPAVTHRLTPLVHP